MPRSVRSRGNVRFDGVTRLRARLLQGIAMSETINETWIVTALGASVLLFALLSAVQHYRRERLRAELLKNLDHHSWCRWQGKPLRMK
jgi:uncharacterized protein (DUF427 family)